MPTEFSEGFRDFGQPLAQAEPATMEGAIDVMGAAFRQENDVWNAVDLITAPGFQRDPQYNWREAYKKRNLDPADDRHYGAQSEAELDWSVAKATSQDNDRALMGSGGWGGIGAAVFAGIMSPTNFLPFMMPARGAKAFYVAGKYALMASALQELPLHMNQPTSTAAESGLNIAAGTLLVGALGGIAGNVAARRLARIADDMARPPGEAAISKVLTAGDEVIGHEVVPVSKTFTFEHKGELKEFRGEKILSVTPESLGHIAKGMAKGAEVTAENLEVHARANGYDGMATSGFKDADLGMSPIEGRRFLQSDGSVGITPTRAEVVEKSAVTALDDAAPLPKWLEDFAEAVLNIPKGSVRNFDELLQQLSAPEQATVIDELRNNGVDAVDSVLDGTRKYTDPDEKIEVVPHALPDWADSFVPLDESKLFPAETPDNVPVEFGPGVERVAQPGGAAVVPVEGMRPAPMTGWGWLDDLALRYSPVTRVLNAMSNVKWRWGMSQFTSGGLSHEGNIEGRIAAPGGTIQANVARFRSPSYKGRRGVWKAYQEYRKNTPTNSMNYKAFREEIGKAGFRADESPVSGAGAASAAVRSTFFKPVWDYAVKVGLGREGLPAIMKDLSWNARMYDQKAIRAKPAVWLEALTKHTLGVMQERWYEELGKVKASIGRAEQTIEDIMSPDVGAIKEKLEADLEKLNEKAGPDLLKLDADVELARAQVRAAKGGADTKAAKEALKVLKETGGEPYKQFAKERGTVKGRLRRLTSNVEARSARSQAKLTKIERAEELSMNGLRGLLKRAEKFTAARADLDPKLLAREAMAIRSEIAKLAKTYGNVVKRIQGAGDDADWVGRSTQLQVERLERIIAMSADAKRLESHDFEGWRMLLEERQDDLIAVQKDIVERRALRNQRLREQIKQLDPKVLEKRIEKLRKRAQGQENRFVARMVDLGAEDLDFAKGTADFGARAAENSQKTTDIILGETLRMHHDAVMGAERGSELARTLTIATDEIMDFVEKDVFKIMDSYERTMVPDMLIKERFGDTNTSTWLEGMRKEKEDKITQIMGTDESVEKKNAAIEKLKREEASHERDFKAIVMRARNQYGIPKYPNGVLARGGRILMNLNYLRYMGMNVVSSLPDPAYIVMRHGFVRTFRAAVIPFLNGMKFTPEDRVWNGNLAIGVESELHSRMHAMSDMLTSNLHRSAIEDGLEYATAKMGMISLFEPWTDFWSKVSSVATTTRMMEDIEVVVRGGVSQKRLERATTYLAKYNIDGDMARRIWGRVEAGGANRIGSRWVPNTDDWVAGKTGSAYAAADFERQTLQAAVIQSVHDTIVRPGWEKPLFADMNLPMRMFMQFRGFAMASTTNMFMAGLQQRDMNFLNGIMMALGAGAMSYYLSSMAKGGDAQKRMMNADIGKWFDESLDRSGILAIGNEVWRMLQEMPWLRSTLSGEQTSRRRFGVNAYAEFGGPSLAFGQDVVDIMMQLGQPTKNTVHTIEQLLPFSNNVLLSGALHGIEAATGTRLNPAELFPERRTQ